MKFHLACCAILMALPLNAKDGRKSWARSVRDVLNPWLSDLNKTNWDRLIRDIENSDDIGYHYDSDNSHEQRPEGITNDPTVVRCSFKDIAGGVPPDITTTLDLIKNSEKYKKFGLTTPKGILLVGPPGTGKTLLARAIAGEAGCGFFYTSATEFIEVYVGTGPARVRELFAKAKNYSASHRGQKVIIFIDELDAIGNRSSLAGHDSESRRTLNELLTQMDGFASSSEIIVIGATNSSKGIDDALKRAGRFDTIIEIPLPTRTQRQEVLEHYARKIPSAVLGTINFGPLAERSNGFNNADLKELVRSATLEAAQENAARVEQHHFVAALEKIKNQKRF